MGKDLKFIRFNRRSPEELSGWRFASSASGFTNHT
jgi:hypothetical protein